VVDPDLRMLLVSDAGEPVHRGDRFFAIYSARSIGSTNFNRVESRPASARGKDLDELGELAEHQKPFAGPNDRIRIGPR
jgi:hypothetical protein